MADPPPIIVAGRDAHLEPPDRGVGNGSGGGTFSRPLLTEDWIKQVPLNRELAIHEVSGMTITVGDGKMTTSCQMIAGRRPRCSRPSFAGSSTQWMSPYFMPVNSLPGLQKIPELMKLSWPDIGKVLIGAFMTGLMAYGWVRSARKSAAHKIEAERKWICPA